MCQRVPVPSAIFVGRDEPLRRVEQALVRIPVAVICGLAGIGKSTLALSLAERWANAVVYQRISDGEPLARLIDDARRALARGPVLELGDDAERMADLAERLDNAHALLVIDDLHRLDPGHRRRLVHGIGQRLRRGRLIVTTRELPELGAGVDRLELRLAGLDEASARSLWVALDELYEAAPGFESAWRRAQGNPLLLRQAHAGRPTTDPYAAALGAITSDERRVAGILALGNVPLSTVTLARILPDGRVHEAMRGLATRLIVDVHPNGTCTLHDLFRDELQRGLSADEQASIHAELVRLIQDAELDVVTKVREVCRHLGELARFEEAAQILVAHATELIRHGAARELLCGLEAIPKPQRTMIVQIVHARTLGRLLDLRGAYEALEPLLDAGTEPRLEVLLGFGPIAMLTGRMADAERAFSEVLARRDLAPWLRVRTQFAFGLLLTYQGRGDEGRAFLRGAIANAESREAEGVLLAAEVFCFWLDERDTEAAELLRRASTLLQGCSSSVHSMFLAPAALAITLGRLGRFAEADAWLRQIDDLLAQSTDARSNIVYRAMLVSMDYERGERAKAMAGLIKAAEDAEAGGDILGTLWARTYIARLLLIMGRRRQALSQLDEIATRAHALGILNVVQMVARSRLLDPLEQLRAPSATDTPNTKTGAAVRARCIRALRAARDGDAARVAALLDANLPLTTDADYTLDRALGHLARAVLARAQGDSKLESAALADARREAQSGDIDLDVLDDLDAELGRLRVVTGDRALVRASLAEVMGADSIVLDGQTHELRVGGHVHTLKRQAILREILYVLSAQRGCVVSKQEVAQRLWGGRYDPTVHDNRLWANIHRLRQFLAPSTLNIEFVDDGYRLATPHGFVFVNPRA